MRTSTATDPLKKLKAWFDRSNVSSKYKSVVIEKALHNLKGSEKDIAWKLNNGFLNEKKIIVLLTIFLVRFSY